MSAQHESDYQPGSMDIGQHKRFYLGFLTFTKWSSIGIILIMIFLASSGLMAEFGRTAA